MEQINLKEEVICKIFTTKDPVILGDFFAKKTLVTANTLQSFHVLFLFVGELGEQKVKAKLKKSFGDDQILQRRYLNY